MKLSLVLALAILGLSIDSRAHPLDRAVLASPMVKAIVRGLKREQRLSCVHGYSESGDLNVNYFVEDNLNKFEIFLVCDTKIGLNAVIKGVVGDSGKTKVEAFRMVESIK